MCHSRAQISSELLLERFYRASLYLWPATRWCVTKQRKSAHTSCFSQRNHQLSYIHNLPDFIPQFKEWLTSAKRQWGGLFRWNALIPLCIHPVGMSRAGICKGMCHPISHHTSSTLRRSSAFWKYFILRYLEIVPVTSTSLAA